MADVERFELSYLYLYLVPDIDINRCIEVTVPIMAEMINQWLAGKSLRVYSVVLVIPRWGIGVIRMNPRYRWKRSSIHNRPYVWRKYP
ncbi:hypothetical protein [Granulicella sp. L60]|uniref:hypothetical protein n=1 Tax=Granulicella sp. L60 TaxID=1641866 RepID=UPI00131CCAF7|nr:hypothetical protein [Granulicella sp. L60]